MTSPLPPPPRRSGQHRRRAGLELLTAAMLGTGCGAASSPSTDGSAAEAVHDASALGTSEHVLEDRRVSGEARSLLDTEGVAKDADGSPASAAARPNDATAPLSIDPDVRRAALALVGRSPDDTLLDERARERQRHHRESVEASWASFDREIGTPMSTWAKAQIAPPEEGAPRLVFYPFGGADFVTAHRLAPEATRYVMVAMQRAGPVPDLDALKRSDRDAIHRALRHRVAAFSKSGFFVTTQMNATYHKALPVKGITGQLMLFAELEGYDVLDVSPIRVERETAELVVRTESLDRPATWSSVRLDLRRRSDGAHVTLDYLRMDLSDRGLRPRDLDGDGEVELQHPHERWLRTVASDMVVLKAASHLPQQGAFSRVRDLIVEEAEVVVQDETAIDFDTLSAHFDVRLFGDYREANELFDGRRQRSLAKAYAAAGDVPELPFAYGYRKRAGASLQLGHKKRALPATPDGKIAASTRSD